MSDRDRDQGKDPGQPGEDDASQGQPADPGEPGQSGQPGDAGKDDKTTKGFFETIRSKMPSKLIILVLILSLVAGYGLGSAYPPRMLREKFGGRREPPVVICDEQPNFLTEF